MNKLLVICGPTATGKTDLALTLAKEWNGELVSADSRQMYQGLDALTGKERSKDILIWLYDVIKVDESFSAYDFVLRAEAAIADIQKRGKLPVVVGGTGFYLRVLTRSIDTISIPPDPALRKKLDILSLVTLQEQLQQADSERWTDMNASDRANKRRLIRAIEVAGKPKSPKKTAGYDALWIGLTAPLSILKQRITEHVERRSQEALDEVRDHETLPDILGVDSLRAFFRGEYTKEEALSRWALAEFQYAKRQMTWFRKRREIQWFDVSRARYTDAVVARVAAWYT